MEADNELSVSELISEVNEDLDEKTPPVEEAEEKEESGVSDDSSEESQEDEPSEDADSMEETPDAGKGKFWDVFETEEQARNYTYALQQELQRVQQAQHAHIQGQQQQAFQQKLAEEDQKFVATYTNLILDGKGDQAAVYMRDRVLSESVAIAEMIVDRKLQQMAQYYEGKNNFLRNPSDQDLHPAVDYVEALIRSGLTEKQAKDFLRGAVNAMGAKPQSRPSQVDIEKRKAATKRAKQAAASEEVTSTKRSKKSDDDKFVDDIVNGWWG